MEISEKSNSLKANDKDAQINVNVLTIQRNNFSPEKKSFCSEDVKKHISILCKLKK